MRKAKNRRISEDAMLTGKSVCQIAYFVPDVRAAAKRHSELFGSGPFYVIENIEFATCLHRGKPSAWDHTIAIGQWGDVQVELMQQNAPGPSVLYDVIPDGAAHRRGVHHMAYIIENPPEMAAAFAAKGYPIALHATLGNGIEVFMVDTIDLYGHMIEFYAPTKELMAIHGFVREQAIGWDGSDPIRSMNF